MGGLRGEVLPHHCESHSKPQSALETLVHQCGHIRRRNGAEHEEWWQPRARVLTLEGAYDLASDLALSGKAGPTPRAPGTERSWKAHTQSVQTAGRTRPETGALALSRGCLGHFRFLLYVYL